MSEIKLLPCPFCGGEAEIYVTKHIPEGYDYTPRCKNKSCCGRLSKKFTSEEVAIAFWNKRKPMERIIGRLKQQEEQYKARSQKCKELKYPQGADKHYGKACSYNHAIEICKEEGGIE